MIALDVADLVVIASRTLRADTGLVLDLLDPAAAESALARAWSGGEPGDPAGRAAALLHALLRERPLRRGNQQVALAATLQFLALNGWDVDPDPRLAGLVAGLAGGALDTPAAAAWLAPRLRAAGRSETLVKEAPMRPTRPLAEKIKMATRRTQPRGMFRRFTDRARRAVHLAREEALLLRHDHVGTEHLLLGLLYEGEGVAAHVLESLGISREDVRGQVDEIIGHGQSPPRGDIPFTPAARRALRLALQESLQLGHRYIGTEHVLLGLLREAEGVAAQVLNRLGADHARVRGRMLDLLAGRRGPADPQAEPASPAAPAAPVSPAAPAAPVSPAGPAVPAGLARVTEQLAQLQRQRQAALDAGDLDTAAALRDRERQLLADKLRLEHRWTAEVDVQAVIADNQRLHRELDRLRDLLRQHGIEPDDGTARTA
jgi:prophage maintenance system killer protein